MVSLCSLAGASAIARRLGFARHRVSYYLRTRKLAPLVVLGRLKFLSEAVVEQIASALCQINESKEVRAQ